VILLDFETRSRCDLKVRGGRLYGADPSTEAICCVLHDTATGAWGLWETGEPAPFGPEEMAAAHNAMGFDRFIGERLAWPAITVDTSELARRAGLPGALDALGQRWLGRQKDKAGSLFTKSLSRPSRARARLGQLPDLTPDVRARVAAYCASDVEIMAHGWARLRPYLEDGVFGGWEADVSRVDRVVNDRGIAFDVDLARALLAADDRNQGAAIAEAAGLCGWTPEDVRRVVGSPVQFAEWTGAPDATADTVQAIIDDGAEDDRVVALARARQSLATIAGGKLEAGLNRVSRDGRIRDSHRYYGAHTGRWSGKGMQLQNIPRPVKRFEKWGADEIDRAVAEALRGDDIDAELMNVLLRATLCAKPGHTFVVCDFSGVEARALAWVAGDAKAIDVFKAYDAGTGPDPYIVAAVAIFTVMASEISKEQRTAGKMAELACGYQGGAAALERIAAAMGVDVSTWPVSPEAVVAAWRTLHRPIVEFWYAIEKAFHAAIDGHASKVACFDVCPNGQGDVAIFLPSGRPIVYNAVGVHHDVWPDGRPKRQAYYRGTKSGREWLYGGKLTENVIQALCRDLMADALVRAEDAGLCPVLHVHDEIVCEVPANAGAEGLALLRAIMLDVAEWADGFPIGAAGHFGRRYRK
jgi:DNA polymerase